MTQTFTLDIPDDSVSRIIEAMVVNYGYRDEIADPDNAGATIPNPQTHTEFAMEQVKKFLADNVRTYETNKAMAEAVNSVTPVAF